MVKKHNEEWTTQDLELFHDDELHDSQRSALGDALRRDPDLRERLATVRRVDDRLLDSFEDIANVSGDRRTGVKYPGRWVAVAACVLLSVSAVWHLKGGGSLEGTGAIVENGDASRKSFTPPATYEPIRIVFSLPVRPKQVSETSDAESGLDITVATKDEDLLRMGDREFLSRLNYALTGGRVQETVRLLDGATSDQRIVAYKFLGELLRSADVAEKILDGLSPHEQLAVCRIWAHEPGRRPVVFARLHRFSLEPELSGEIRTIIAEFNEDPSLKTWLRSYRFAEPDRSRHEASS